MIHAVRANRPSFRAVEFTNGFNIVVADRTKDSRKKDSRNGLGKTTLIEIIHFCLGSKAPRPGRGLRTKLLRGWVFSLEITLGQQRIIVRRSVDDPKSVVLEGDLRGFKGKVSLWDQLVLSVEDWTMILGEKMFGLPRSEQDQLYSPTFRSLISYIARRGRGGFLDPFEHMSKQRAWSRQVNVAFLLRLSWENARVWQELKDEETALRSLKKAATTGLVKGMLGKLGELETEKVRLEEIARRRNQTLRSFKVHEEYREIEKEATRLTAEISSLSNDNFMDRQMLDLYREGLTETLQPETDEITSLYEQFGVQLPGVVTRRLEEVRTFHHVLINNRKKFLDAEIRKLRRQIDQREHDLRRFSDQRAGLMTTLEGHGALEDFNRLQQRYSGTLSQLEDIKQKVENLRAFETGTSELKIKQEELQQRTRLDHDERQTLRERAISLFNANSQDLYQAPGRLVVDIGKSGYKFDVNIERSGSEGIESMKIFCYDLMVAELWSEMKCSPGFLIHDSTLFDGVDERQVALALERAAEVSANSGFQYICTFNSDMIPTGEFSPEFVVDDYIRLRLTDASPEGSLLGLRY